MAVIFRELINSSIDATDSEDVIRQVGKLLYDNEFVKDTYIDAVAKREKEFPTGLILKSVQVAMPHTDSVHVHKPAVCVAKLANPVTFCHMGDPDTLVQAELIFMMAISSPDDQIDTLRKVMNVFQNESAALEFKNAKDDEELYQVAKNYLG